MQTNLHVPFLNFVYFDAVAVNGNAQLNNAPISWYNKFYIHVPGMGNTHTSVCSGQQLLARNARIVFTQYVI